MVRFSPSLHSCRISQCHVSGGGGGGLEDSDTEPQTSRSKNSINCCKHLYTCSHVLRSSCNYYSVYCKNNNTECSPQQQTIWDFPPFFIPIMASLMHPLQTSHGVNCVLFFQLSAEVWFEVWHEVRCDVWGVCALAVSVWHLTYFPPLLFPFYAIKVAAAPLRQQSGGPDR